MKSRCSELPGSKLRGVGALFVPLQKGAPAVVVMPGGKLKQSWHGNVHKWREPIVTHLLMIVHLEYKSYKTHLQATVKNLNSQCCAKMTSQMDWTTNKEWNRSTNYLLWRILAPVQETVQLTDNVTEAWNRHLLYLLYAVAKQVFKLQACPLHTGLKTEPVPKFTRISLP